MAVGSSATTPPRRYVAYTASFSCKHTLQQVYEFLTTHLKISREDMRLWKVKDEVCRCLCATSKMIRVNLKELTFLQFARIFYNIL